MPDTEHIVYSTEDIHRYFSGKMNASEMHAMEKASLNDALLAEAMEGYQTLNNKDFIAVQKQLDELREKISGKTVSIKKYNNWWKVAAAVLLLIGSVFAFYRISKNNNKQENTVVSVPQVKAVTDSGVALKQDNSPKIDSSVVMADVKQNNVSHKDVRIQKNKRLFSNNATAVNDNSSIAMNDIKLNAPAEQQAGKEFTNNTFAAKNMPLAKSMKAEFKNSNAITFSGKVTDADNNAIPFATLIINNNQQSKTDANGSFNLSLPDSSIRLDVAANNYYPKTTNITANNFASIVLTLQKNTLKKSAVMDTLIRCVVQLLYKRGVEPKEGWERYLRFLVDQFSNSEYDDGRRVTGEMIFQFEVNESLLPDNFQVEKSIDEDVMDAVENFIINHSNWQLLPHGGTPGIVRLRIIF
jgi:hypothetical protein